MPQLAMIMGAAWTAVKTSGPEAGVNAEDYMKAEEALAGMYMHKLEIRSRLQSAIIERCEACQRCCARAQVIFVGERIVCNSCIQELFLLPGVF